MNNTALLVVDIQTALVEDHPYRETVFLNNVKKLLAKARETGIEVIYVRHDGGEGDSVQAGTRGWEIYHEIAPSPSVKIFDKKFSSAFRDTGLRSYLTDRAISHLVLVGMQTEYCIDATCKAAFEHGFDVTVPEGATTTYDNRLFSAEDMIRFYEKIIWDGRFARVIPLDDVSGIFIRR